MFPGTTVRAVLTLLTAALLALQLFAPTAGFAPAHTLRHAEARAEPGTTSPAPPVGDGEGSLRVPGCAGDPVGVPLLRERQRRSFAGGPRQHPLTAVRIADGNAPAAPGAVLPSAPVTARAHAPAVLQVCRC
ncbi:hypothetical protein ACIRU5_34475 [Streptomyces misionensis]|uniref:hypothetical protein n=1 Tax=Streptomyces misionensis TaxID=67331 RepID=UPI0037F7192A